MDITAIKSNKGYYIHRDKSEGGYSQSMHLDNYLFDGINPQKTFNDQWFFIDNIPSKVSHYERQPNINHRYILADGSLESDKIPATIMKVDVGDEVDDGGNIIWKPELSLYKSLYTELSDEQPSIEVIDDFTFNVVLEIGDVTDPVEFTYPTGHSYDRWAKDNRRDNFVRRGNIIHQDLDKIIFPSLLIHETPCVLSSEDTYKIVREYISTHINPSVAVITSNYDFCFTVKKRVPLAKSYQAKYTDSSKRKGSKDRIRMRMVTHREFPIFEMTHSKSMYQGYTPIQGFEARNEQELKETLDSYMEDLSKQINEPVTECPTCNGCGVLFDEVKENRIGKDGE